MLIQFFLQDVPIIQLTLNVVLSLAVSFMQNFTYLMVFRPFNETILNVSNILCECGIFLIFVLAAINLMRISSDMHDNLDTMLVALVSSIMYVQMASSLLVFSKTIVLVIRKKMQTKVVPINMEGADIKTN